MPANAHLGGCNARLFLCIYQPGSWQEAKSTHPGGHFKELINERTIYRGGKIEGKFLKINTLSRSSGKLTNTRFTQVKCRNDLSGSWLRSGSQRWGCPQELGLSAMQQSLQIHPRWEPRNECSHLFFCPLLSCQCPLLVIYKHRWMDRSVCLSREWKRAEKNRSEWIIDTFMTFLWPCDIP